MNFIECKQRLQLYTVFSLQEIQKVVPNISAMQVMRWQKKGYIKNIRRGYYMFADVHIDEWILLHIANTIYTPSYISLQWALKYYGLIPEEVFQLTSVSTKKTNTFVTNIGNFSYKHVKPSLFWGYTLIETNNQKVLLAEPEKAILDYLYLHPTLQTSADFESLRINTNTWNDLIQMDKFNAYLAAFGSIQLTKRARIFLQSIDHD